MAEQKQETPDNPMPVTVTKQETMIMNEACATIKDDIKRMQDDIKKMLPVLGEGIRKQSNVKEVVQRMTEVIRTLERARAKLADALIVYNRE